MARPLNPRLLLFRLGFKPVTDDHGVEHGSLWRGHGLEISAPPGITNPAVLMDHILTAQKRQIRETNRQHLAAVYGPIPGI